MNREQLQESLVGELRSLLGRDIGPEDNLLFEGGLDSFGIMQMVAYLEDTYRIRVPEGRIAMASFSSASTIADWVLPLAK